MLGRYRIFRRWTWIREAKSAELAQRLCGDAVVYDFGLREENYTYSRIGGAFPEDET